MHIPDGFLDLLIALFLLLSLEGSSTRPLKKLILN